jgi:hypothetical protein
MTWACRRGWMATRRGSRRPIVKSPCSGWSGASTQRALQVLERGREKIGAPGALALELGDVQLAAGNLEQAVRDWDRAVGTAGQGFMGVQRRLRALPDGGSAASPLLVRSLVRDPSTVGRQRAALRSRWMPDPAARQRKSRPVLRRR